MTETDFIAALRKLPLHPGARGLADDCAVLELGGETLVVTHDSMVEGVHWLAPESGGQDMADVAWKLVAVNLSDLAAKGAMPLGVLLGHSLGNEDARFLVGLGEVLEHYDVPLLGGDTVAGNGPRTLGLTALGRATHRPVPCRSGARVGDQIWVTGRIGAAMLGFEALREGTGGEAAAFTRPRARLSEGRTLAQYVSAMMDVSDGLLLDALRMAEASGATLALTSELVPVADPARARECMCWGDDYELLFALPAGLASPIPASRIGHVAPRGEASLVLDGVPIADPAGLGFLHRPA